MSNNLPIKPGPYYWRDYDSAEWELCFLNLDEDGDLCMLDVDVWVAVTEFPSRQWVPIPTADELVELQSAKKMVDEKHDGWAIFQRGEFCLSVPTQDYVIRLIEKITGYPWVTLSSEANYTCEPVTIYRNQDQK